MDKQIEVGAIYRMNLDEKDEVTPKGGLDFRPKFLVIIGTADYGYYVAYVIINKGINKRFICTKELQDQQFPLRVKDYPQILDIDPSYVNLARIREMETARLSREATYQGKLTERDLNLVLDTLRNSEVITTKEKKRFGLIQAKPID